MKKLARCELIGMEALVIKAKNKSLIGAHGIIIDETRNMLAVEHNHTIKQLPKDQIKLRLKVNHDSIDIEGKALVGRPEDRLKKKVTLS